MWKKKNYLRRMLNRIGHGTTTGRDGVEINPLRISFSNPIRRKIFNRRTRVASSCLGSGAL